MKIRRFKNGDEEAIVNVVKRTSREVNIRDYTPEQVEEICRMFDNEKIKTRALEFHMYVILDENTIIGVGAIGPYWCSETESSLFNIFILPEYEGKGLGRKLIEVLEEDEYFKRADRVEIPSSITGLNFYRHMGYGFKRIDKVFGNIVDEEGEYRLEKFPKISNDNNTDMYNARPYINNEYHNYYEFIYEVKKEAYKEYVILNFGDWVEEVQRSRYDDFINSEKDNIYILEYNGEEIGFYNGKTLEDGSYEIGNICIIPDYQSKGFGTKILKDVLEKHKNQDIRLQYFKQNSVGSLYERLGFIHNGETEFHYQMIKYKESD